MYNLSSLTSLPLPYTHVGAHNQQDKRMLGQCRRFAAPSSRQPVTFAAPLVRHGIPHGRSVSLIRLRWRTTFGQLEHIKLKACGTTTHQSKAACNRWTNKRFWHKHENDHRAPHWHWFFTFACWSDSFKHSETHHANTLSAVKSYTRLRSVRSCSWCFSHHHDLQPRKMI